MILTKKNIYIFQLVSVLFIGITSKMLRIFDMNINGIGFKFNLIFYLLPYAFLIILIPIFFKNLKKKFYVTLVMIALSLMNLLGNLT